MSILNASSAFAPNSIGAMQLFMVTSSSNTKISLEKTELLEELTL